MAVLKCKMCGGNLEVAENVTVCECEYCGTQQTLPKTHDEVITNLFNRANNLRSKCEFDKAQEIYEKIVSSDSEESEAYWGIILCKYGIEYVEDPATFKKIPTCHRTQLESVRTDADYAAAIEHADAVQKGVYEKEAEAIDKLQKDILAIVHNEKPFDVFICYKETDENGKRTSDSVIANDIYHQLTAEGFKVFYAAITLEDKLGQAYEPYIFAALNSAKVMLSIGTKPEYFTAVWVRNEWSRFLKLIKNDRSKLLIPCYKDMDAYDLPEEFSHLQAQDMSKIGFINDVIRGIKKVIVKDEPQAAPVQNVTVTQTASGNVENLLKRGNLCLEDGKWEEADKFFEQVLNENAEEARAYLGKLLAELKVSSLARLVDADVKPFEFLNNYEKAIRFGSPEFVEKLKKINLQHKYNIATAYMRKAATPEAYLNAKKLFEEISKFSDAKSKAEECESQAVALECQAEEERKNKIYDSAVSKMNSGDTIKVEQAIKEFESIIDWRDSGAKIDECRDVIKDITYNFAKSLIAKDNIDALDKAKTTLMAISDWKESAELIEKCKARIAEIEAENVKKQKEEQIRREKEIREKEIREREQKKKKTITFVTVAVILVVVAAIIAVLVYVVIPASRYDSALKLMENGKYNDAITAFEALGDYKDSAEKVDMAFELYKPELIRNADIGDYVFAGKIEQDSNLYNGMEDIEWLVLDKDENGILLTTRYGLISKKYNEIQEDVNWENCTLREWLNSEFLDSTFTDEEKERILTFTNINDNNNKTQDKLFLFSYGEANKYFPSEKKKQLEITKFAKRRAGIDKKSDNCRWLLRSVGDVEWRVDCITENGVISETSCASEYVIRPAMWVSTK